MRALALFLSLTTACATTSFKVPSSELQRLAQVPPEQRGEHVRVTQQLSNDDLGPAYPVEAHTTIIIFPEPNVYGPDRQRYYRYGNGGTNVGAGGGRSVTPGSSGVAAAARRATARPRRSRSS